MRIDDNDVPHIQAQCAGCGFLFDMKFGNDCPACHHIGVKWARLIKCATCGDTGNVNGEPCEGCIRAEPTMESQRALHDDPAMKAVDTYLRWQHNAVDLDPDTTRDIIWCEKLYALDNEGSTR